MSAPLGSLAWPYYFAAFVFVGAALSAAAFFKAWKAEHFVFLDEIRSAIEGGQRGACDDEILRELKLTVALLVQSAELTKLNTETLIVMIEELRRLRLGDTEPCRFPWEIDPSYSGVVPSRPDRTP